MINEILRKLCAAVAFSLLLSAVVLAQDLDFERTRHADMLGTIIANIKKNYYDPKYRGHDIDAKYIQAKEKMKAAQSINQLTGIVAQFLLDFEDSHLFFVPPQRVNKYDYGFESMMIGENCFVTRVKDESDAFKKGLRVGDQIAKFNGFVPTREQFWKLNYLFYTLRPQQVIKLEIVRPESESKEIVFEAKITVCQKVIDPNGQGIHILIRESEDAYLKSQKQYFSEKVDGITIWKVPAFSLEPSKVDDIMNKYRRSKAIIFDLRGNGGGRVDMLTRLIANVFPRNVKVGDEVTRSKTREIIAKTRGNDAFEGKVIVLIDSRSGSASEVFAKVIQLEKRGVVMGDRSGGAVMESRYFGESLGIDRVVYFGASITIADLIMTDGKSIEKVGVSPEEIILQNAKDLASNRDLALSRAVEYLGGTLTPEDAAKLFPPEREKP